MNEKIKDGGPAFPVPDVIDHDRNYYQYGGQGMTLRDYFAAKAIPSVITQCKGDIRRADENPPDYFARVAFEIADAMLSAREAKS